MEYALYSLWKINVIDLIKIKASLSKQFHIQPSEIDKMNFWEYEYYVTMINDMVKEENKDQQSQMSKYGVDKYTNPNNIKKYTNPKMPSTPKMPSVNLKY